MKQKTILQISICSSFLQKTIPVAMAGYNALSILLNVSILSNKAAITTELWQNNRAAMLPNFMFRALFIFQIPGNTARVRSFWFRPYIAMLWAKHIHRFMFQSLGKLLFICLFFVKNSLITLFIFKLSNCCTSLNSNESNKIKLKQKPMIVYRVCCVLCSSVFYD